ncbi:MAG: energy transducer TonB, partial [Muribaculaceae bacterium]|nr:energy transducer TonB [Muribaculaceae bacterium]
KDLQEKKKDLSATVSAKVPLNAKQLHMKMTYKGRMGDFSCLVYWDVLDEASTSSNSFKWDDVGVGDRCSHCNGQFSNYYVNNFIGNVSIVCNSGKGKRKLESNNGKLQPIHYNDYFVTVGGGDYLILDYYDETEVLKIMENSKVLLQKRLPNGSDRWVIYKGKIVGKGLKHAAEPSFQMSTCIVTPTGTTYVLEDDGKTSKVLLLEGSMEVTANKTSKKQTLKPGQIATVASNGTINVGSFDVGATAKQYGIKGISTSSTSNSNTSKTAHVNKSQSPQYQTGKQVEKGEVKANTNTKTNTKTNANADNTIYDVAATQPQYPGGAAALNSYIKNSIKYPADAKQQGVTGIVVVQFVVEKDGKLSDIKVSRKGKLPSLDAEALRVVKSLSKFTPGRNEKGQPVRVKYSLPVQFKLP